MDKQLPCPTGQEEGPTIPLRQPRFEGGRITGCRCRSQLDVIGLGVARRRLRPELLPDRVHIAVVTESLIATERSGPAAPKQR